MKHWRLQLHCLLAVLLPVLVLPCHAMERPTFSEVSSFEELLKCYHKEDAAKSTRAYLAQKPLVCREETILGKTLGGLELIAAAGLRVTAGSTLILDNPNLLIMGPPPCITVEAGGTLRILNWGARMTHKDTITDQMLAIEAGGTLYLGNGIVLPEGMVVDHNPPPDTGSPPVVPTEPDPEPKPDPKPDPEPKPEPIPQPPAPPFALTGEIMKVSPRGEMTVYLTIPRLPEDTKGFSIQRSEDGLGWTRMQTFGVSTTLHDAIPQWEAAENPILVSKHSDDGTCTFLPCLTQVSNKTFFLRVVLEQNNGKVTVSQQVKILPHPDSPEGDYDNSGGNQGGGGQGQTDRSGQQTPPPAEQIAASPPAPAEEVIQASPLESVAEEEQRSVVPLWPTTLAATDISWAGSIESTQAPTAHALGRQPTEKTPAPSLPPKETEVDEKKPLKNDEETDDLENAESASQTTAVELGQVAALPATPKPHGDGDRVGFAALASLVLCGGAAVAGTLRAKKKYE